jgi:hypothetical protein
MEEKNIVAYFSGLSATIKSVKEVQKLYNHQLAFNFNSLNFLRPGENKYSEILAFFLNPKEVHGQGNIFLKLFLKNVGLEDKVSDIDFVTVDCKCEHVIDDQRRIDILIRFGHNKFVIAIENKVWAIDQDKQLKDYNTYLNREFAENYCLLYLTPYIKNPSIESIETHSFKELQEKGLFKLIGYKKHIIVCVHNWVLHCQAERVRVFLLDFEQYLKKEFLGQTFMDENKTIVEYVVKNSENIEIAFATFNAIEEIKIKLLYKLRSQIEAIANDNDLEAYVDKDLGRNYDYTRFSFYKKSWKYINISFQFGAKNANDFRYGLSLKGAGGIDDIPISIPDELKKSVLQVFNIPQVKGEWWLFSNDFDVSIKNWGNQSQPWMEIQNGKMKERIGTIVKEFLAKIGSLEL